MHWALPIKNIFIESEDLKTNLLNNVSNYHMNNTPFIFDTGTNHTIFDYITGMEFITFLINLINLDQNDAFDIFISYGYIFFCIDKDNPDLKDITTTIIMDKVTI